MSIKLTTLIAGALLIASPALAGGKHHAPPPQVPSVPAPESAIAHANSVATASGTGIGYGGGGGGGGAGGRGGGGGASAATVRNTVNANTYYPKHQRIATTGNGAAPSLFVGGEDTCVGAVSVGAGWVGFSGSFGFTPPLTDCNRRSYARMLNSMGRRDAALIVLTNDPEVRDAMVKSAEARGYSYGPDGRLVRGRRR